MVVVEELCQQMFHLMRLGGASEEDVAQSRHEIIHGYTAPAQTEQASKQKRRKVDKTHYAEALARDGYQCVYCDGKEDITVDHIVSVVRGGTDELSNLVACCRRCNSSKGGMSLERWERRLAYLPTTGGRH